ncbi:DUF533 domain-containing protein [Tabrizicola sp.]|uniref:DUF533 domain-containing protein n=1 Tax=Tabrizicola sp. TaxID=2005166 RepID=UPI003F402E44
MSLGKTLLKVAIGIAVVKGVTSLAKGGSTQAEAPTGGTTTAGRGTRYDGENRGGLEDLLGEVLGSGSTAQSGRQRDVTIQDTLAQRGGSQRNATRDSGTANTGGSLGDLLDQISGQKRSTPRKTAPTGGLDDLLGELTGKSSGRSASRESGSFGGSAGGNAGGIGDLLDQVLNGRRPGAPVELPEPQREEELSAALMLRAVIQAVKCDGELDADEKARLMKAMGDADQREVQAVNAELQRPVDVEGLARSVPAGLEPQVYVMSLMAINLDQQAEAQYLHSLAQALDLSPAEVNALHDRARVPRLYR